MAALRRESPNEMMAEPRARFAALQASGEVTPQVATVFETPL